MDLQQIAAIKNAIANGTAQITQQPVQRSGEGGTYTENGYMLNLPSGEQMEVDRNNANGTFQFFMPNPENTGDYKFTFGADESGKTTVTDPESFVNYRNYNPSTGGFLGSISGTASDFLNSDAGKLAAIAAMYYGGPAALEALSSGAATTVPEAINMGTGFVSPEIAGSAASAVGGTGAGLAATAPVFTAELPAGSGYVAPQVTPLSQVASTEAGVGLTAPEAAAGAGAAQGLTGSSTALGDISGGVASETGSLIPDFAVPAAAGAAAAGAGSSLSSMLPYVAGAGVVSGLIGANAATTAAQTQADAAAKAQAQQQTNFETINKQQAPYRATGYNALNDIANLTTGQTPQYDANGNIVKDAAGNPVMTTGSGYLQHQFNAADLAAGLAPNYDFMLQQGQMANQRAANVAGGGLSGNTLQGLQKYTQDYAGNAYQNAFTNYQNQRTNIYNTLAGIAGIGQTGQTATNTAATNATNAVTQLGVGSAAATAAGGTGAANAYTNAINNATNNYTLAALLNQRGNVTSPTA